MRTGLALLCLCGVLAGCQAPDVRDYEPLEPSELTRFSTEQLLEELRSISPGFRYGILMDSPYLPGAYVPPRDVNLVVLELSRRSDSEEVLLDTYVVRPGIRLGDFCSSMVFPLLDALLLFETSFGRSTQETRARLWERWCGSYWTHDGPRLELEDYEALITERRSLR